MKVTYTSYTAVAEWKWDLPEEADDTCGICRVQFEGTCAKCKYPGEDCPISKSTFSISTSVAILPPVSRLLTSCTSYRCMHALLPHALHQRVDGVRGESGQVSDVPAGVQGEGGRSRWISEPSDASADGWGGGDICCDLKECCTGIGPSNSGCEVERRI